MPQRWSASRLTQGCPAGLSSAKSADLANAGATQHRPKHRAQSARSSVTGPPLGRPSTVIRVRGRPVEGPAQCETNVQVAVDAVPGALSEVAVTVTLACFAAEAARLAYTGTWT